MPMSSGITSAQVRLRARKGYIHTKRPWGPSLQGAVSAGYTIQTDVALEAMFDAVRVLYNSDGGANNTYAGEKVCVAASAKLNNSKDPVDAASGALTWTNVTFNDAGVFNLPPSATGSTVAAPAIAAGAGTTSTTVESHLASDWVPILPQARADAGQTLPLLFVRTYYPNASRATNGVPTGWHNDSAVNNERLITTAYQLVDGVTTPANFTNTSFGAGGLPFASFGALQYLSRYRGLSVHCIGDSIKAGYGSQNLVSGMRPWGHIACAALSTLTRPISFTNWGVVGQTTALILQRVKAYLRDYSPDVVFITPYSSNDGATTLAAAQAGMYQARAVIAMCVEYGIIPIVCTATPWAATGGTETTRLAVNTEIRSWGSLGVLVCDHDAIIRDPNAQSTILASLCFDGVQHPNDAGYAAMAVEAQRCINIIVAANF